MSRSLLILNSPNVRERAIKWVKEAPHNTRVEFRETKRSLPQNDKFWAVLTDVSKQVLHFGRAYPADIWKVLFMAAMGREVKFVPALDGNSVVPLGYRSSELDKAEMSELIEFILAWGAEHGVIFHDHETKEAGGAETPPTPDKEGATQRTRTTQSTQHTKDLIT